MPEIACVNGEFMALADAKVHVEDRGFQFADSVYEVLRTYRGRLFALEEHLARLLRSLEAIALAHSFTRPQLADLLQEAVRRAQFRESMLYLQITRGQAPRHRGAPETLTPTVVVTVRSIAPFRRLTAGQDLGLRLITLPDARWARCDIKSVALLPNVLAYHAAHQAGADDAVFVGADGLVAEASAGNVFVVCDGRVSTPPKGERILAGVTRDQVVRLAGESGVRCAEEPLTREQLLQADEVFLTSTTAALVPARQVDGRMVGTGRVGPVTARLSEAFRRAFVES